jgi:hypothetical protein
MLVGRHERGEGEDRHLITSDEFEEIWTLELEPSLREARERAAAERATPKMIFETPNESV